MQAALIAYKVADITYTCAYAKGCCLTEILYTVNVLLYQLVYTNTDTHCSAQGININPYS